MIHIDNSANTDGWVQTPPYTSIAGKPLIFALDCEMVQTTTGKALARVCVVEYESECVVLDKLVKPEGTIIDYLTQYVSRNDTLPILLII